jgi:hypothetical protein
MRKASIIIFCFLFFLSFSYFLIIQRPYTFCFHFELHSSNIIIIESININIAALIADPAFPEGMKETLRAHSALQATGMKDEEVDAGFQSVSIDSLLLFFDHCCSNDLLTFIETVL